MEQNNDHLFGLEFDQQASDYIVQTAKWSRFLAIMWFVVCSVSMVIFLIVAVTSEEITRDTDLQVGLSVFSLPAIVLLVANIFRYKFAVRALRAIRDTDQLLLNASLNQLRYYQKYWGIVSIVAIALLVIFVLLAALIPQLFIHDY